MAVTGIAEMEEDNQLTPAGFWMPTFQLTGQNLHFIITLLDRKGGEMTTLTEKIAYAHIDYTPEGTPFIAGAQTKVEENHPYDSPQRIFQWLLLAFYILT